MNTTSTSSESIINRHFKVYENFRKYPDNVSHPVLQQEVVGDSNSLAGDELNDQSEYEDNTAVILSVFWYGGKLGVSYFDTDTSEIFIISDIVESAQDFIIVKQVIQQVQPNIIITSSKQDDRFLHILREIGLINSKRCIMGIKLAEMKKLQNDTDRAIYLSSVIDFEYEAVVRSLGGLLRYLMKNRIGMELEDKNIPLSILAVNKFTIKDIVYIDNNTFSALQIFRKEWHPSVYKFGSGTKEGLSLFGIFNRCKSVVGAKAMRLLMLRPSSSIEILKQRLDAISFFIQNQNIDLVNSLQSCLKQIKNIPSILSRMASSEASVNGWLALHKALSSSVIIGDLCKAQPQEIFIFNKISHSFTDGLYYLASLINKIVDFEESASQNHFVVKWGINPELDNKKRTYNGLPDFMSQVARQELEKLHESIKECNVIYLPQVGYLLAIPVTNLMEEKNDFTISGLDHIFTSNKIAYYKTPSTRELDNLLGDTQYEITDQETQIMLHLQSVVLEHTSLLVKVMACIAELDCLLALTMVSKDHNYVQPQLTEENIIEINRGRHPLQELCVSVFVPNDTKSFKNSNKIQMLTGPNASGKSVYLKQVALIIYLAHIGSYVPAEFAKIGIVDKIFSRIHTLESVSIGLSTFMIDLNQISGALQYATNKSIVLVDEFGKGTNSVDGISLLAATLKYWLNKKENCPFVFVSTHLHAVIPLLPASRYLTCLSMDTVQDNDNLVYLYQLVPGQVESSFAKHVAIQAGLPIEIVKRADEVVKAICNNKPIRSIDSSFDEYIVRCNEVVSGFLKLNIETDDVEDFLKRITLSTSEAEEAQNKQNC